jgi:hypothetical protein
MPPDRHQCSSDKNSTKALNFAFGRRLKEGIGAVGFTMVRAIAWLGQRRSARGLGRVRPQASVQPSCRHPGFRVLRRHGYRRCRADWPQRRLCARARMGEAVTGKTFKDESRIAS